MYTILRSIDPNRCCALLLTDLSPAFFVYGVFQGGFVYYSPRALGSASVDSLGETSRPGSNHNAQGGGGVRVMMRTDPVY